MNYFTCAKKFPTEEKIIEYYINNRYGNDLKCHYCQSRKVYKTIDKKKIQCSSCKNTFSIFKNTIFEKSSTDLRKWFYAIHLFLNSKKGISALQLQREIEVTYKTAWRMLHQIRKAMGNKKKDNDDFMSNIIEIDEAYLGGKAENKHMSARIRAKGKFKKNVILGILERAKEFRAFKLDNAKTNTIYDKIFDNIKEGSKIITDEFRAYYCLYNRYDHQSVNHSQGQFRKDKDIHTNSIEGFWSNLKRGIYGIYHHISTKHIQNYMNEFCFRYNERDNKFVFDKLIRQCVFINA